MGAIKEEYNYIDVICQHTRDGRIIPMRIRFIDEDGQFQNYTVREYKDISQFSYTMPNGVSCSSHLWQFLCKIQVFDSMKTVRIMYNAIENKWKMVV